MLKGMAFCHLKKKIGNKYGKKIMDIATKTGINAAKIASKQVVQKTTETTGDLIGNNIADKITSIGNQKKRKKQRWQKKITFHQK